MDEFPAKIADYLESTATRIRELTVERAAGWARWAAIGVVIAIVGLVVLVFALVAIFRLVAGLVGVEETYTIFGAIFVIAGIFLWTKRLPKSDDERLAEGRDL